jgi:hypothetical protein
MMGSIFGPKLHIMAYRQFLIIADDGQLDLGPLVSFPPGFEPFQDLGVVYSDAAAMNAAIQLTQRSINKLLPSMLQGTAFGAGSLPTSYIHLS